MLMPCPGVVRNARGVPGLPPSSGATMTRKGSRAQRVERLAAERMALDEIEGVGQGGRLAPEDRDQRAGMDAGELDLCEIVEALGPAGVDRIVVGTGGLDHLAERRERLAGQRFGT